MIQKNSFRLEYEPNSRIQLSDALRHIYFSRLEPAQRASVDGGNLNDFTNGDLSNKNVASSSSMRDWLILVLFIGWKFLF